MNIYGSTQSKTGLAVLRENNMGIEVFSPPVELNDNLDEYNKTTAELIKGMNGVSMHGA